MATEPDYGILAIFQVIGSFGKHYDHLRYDWNTSIVWLKNFICVLEIPPLNSLFPTTAVLGPSDLVSSREDERHQRPEPPRTAAGSASA